MKTKRYYTSPQCAMFSVQASSFLCLSGELDPIIDNPGIITLDSVKPDDFEWIY